MPTAFREDCTLLVTWPILEACHDKEDGDEVDDGDVAERMLILSKNCELELPSNFSDKHILSLSTLCDAGQCNLNHVSLTRAPIFTGLCTWSCPFYDWEAVCAPTAERRLWFNFCVILPRQVSFHLCGLPLMNTSSCSVGRGHHTKENSATTACSEPWCKTPESGTCQKSRPLSTSAPTYWPALEFGNQNIIFAEYPLQNHGAF